MKIRQLTMAIGEALGHGRPIGCVEIFMLFIPALSTEYSRKQNK